MTARVRAPCHERPSAQHLRAHDTGHTMYYFMRTLRYGVG